MINLQMQLSPVILSQFNIMLHQQSQARGLSRKKFYPELGLEHRHDRHWIRRLYITCKVFLNKVPKYIYELILSFRHSFKNPNSLTSFICRTECFKNSFFQSFINDWTISTPIFAILPPIVVSEMP